MSVVDIINEILQSNNLDIAGLSERTGISAGPLYKMARGETKKFSYQSAVKLNAAFPEYTIEYLRGSDKDDNNSTEEKTVSTNASMEDLLADRVVQKLKPLITSIHQSASINALAIEILQHLALDTDELKDKIEIMEKHMKKISEMHGQS